MKIFISYSTKDKWFTDMLVEFLNKHEIKNWYGETDVDVGDVISRKIYAGLEESTHLIVVLSQNSIKSKWVRDELEAFYHDYVDGKKAKIYPLLLDDVLEQALPFLKKLAYADFRGSTAQTLNPKGFAEIEKELIGESVYDGSILKCRRNHDLCRLVITMPHDKSKKVINEMAKEEIIELRSKVQGKELLVTGRSTIALAIMLGAFLGNICRSIKCYDPMDPLELVPVFKPSN